MRAIKPSDLLTDNSGAGVSFLFYIYLFNYTASVPTERSRWALIIFLIILFNYTASVPTERSPHSYPQLSGGFVWTEEACTLNEQVKSKPTPPKDFHSWPRITISPDIATSFSNQQ